MLQNMYYNPGPPQQMRGNNMPQMPLQQGGITSIQQPLQDHLARPMPVSQPQPPMQYRGGSKDFDFTGGLGRISLPQPMPVDNRQGMPNPVLQPINAMPIQPPKQVGGPVQPPFMRLQPIQPPQRPGFGRPPMFGGGFMPQPPMFGGGFGGGFRPQPPMFGGGFGRPPMFGGGGFGRPPMFGGGGFGGGFGRPPMFGGGGGFIRPPMYGGGFGGGFGGGGRFGGGGMYGGGGRFGGGMGGNPFGGGFGGGRGRFGGNPFQGGGLGGMFPGMGGGGMIRNFGPDNMGGRPQLSMYDRLQQQQQLRPAIATRGPENTRQGMFAR